MTTIRDLFAWRGALAPLLIGLAACSSGGDDAAGPGSGFCATVIGGSTNVRSTGGACNDCEVTDRHFAIDDNANTAARVHTGAGSPGEIALEATTQSGVMYPAGTRAGFLLAGSLDLALVRTRSNGVVQEDSMSSQQIDRREGRTRVSFVTSLPFDSLEAVLPGDGAATPALGEGRTIQVFEFCAQ